MSEPPRGMSRPHTDTELLAILLDRADLTKDQRHVFEAAKMQLDLIGGKILKSVRDHGFAVLRAQGLLPRGLEKPRRKGVWEDDRFSAVRTKGTVLAEKLLALPLPLKPPGRKAYG